MYTTSKNIVLLLLFTFLLGIGNHFAQTQEGITHSGQQTGQAPFPVDAYEELANPTPPPSDFWKKSAKIFKSIKKYHQAGWDLYTSS